MVENSNSLYSEDSDFSSEYRILRFIIDGIIGTLLTVFEVFIIWTIPIALMPLNQMQYYGFLFLLLFSIVLGLSRTGVSRFSRHSVSFVAGYKSPFHTIKSWFQMVKDDYKNWLFFVIFMGTVLSSISTLLISVPVLSCVCITIIFGWIYPYL